MIFCFSLMMRKDLRDLFDQLAVTRKPNKKLSSEKSRSAPELCSSVGQRKIGRTAILTCPFRKQNLHFDHF